MSTVPPPRDFARTTLRPRHRPLVRALAEAMFAHEDGPSAARLDAFVAEVDAFVSFASRTLRFGLVVMLELVRIAPMLLFYRFATFTRLTRDERARVLERMERSRLVVLTLVFAALKVILCLLFFEQPEELAATGYSPVRRRHARAGAMATALPLVHAEATE
jgi:hypothetical protein